MFRQRLAYHGMRIPARTCLPRLTTSASAHSFSQLSPIKFDDHKVTRFQWRPVAIPVYPFLTHLYLPGIRRYARRHPRQHQSVNEVDPNYIMELGRKPTPASSTEFIEPDAPVQNPYRWLERSFLAVFLVIYAAFWYDQLVDARDFMRSERAKRSDDESLKQHKRAAQVLNQMVRYPYSISFPDHYSNNPEVERKLRELISGKPLPSTAATLFLSKYFAYSPADIFPVPGSSGQWRPYTLFTHLFCHQGILHLGVNYMALKCFLTPLAAPYGAPRVVGIFVAGGALAAGIHSLAEYLINPASKMTMEEIKRKLRNRYSSVAEEDEQIALKRYFRNAIGASSAIISLATISCFAIPQLRVSLVFLPFYDIPIRKIVLCLAAIDLGGLYWFNSKSNIGHAGHVAGYVAGLLLWAFWVRKLPRQPWYAIPSSRLPRAKALDLKNWKP